MSMKYLGQTLDIHGGGMDLKFPHHENELAQSESYTGQPFARYWMHNGLLKMGTAKMAGSVGNVVNIVDLLRKHHPETVRFLLLSTHYRSEIEYGEERLAEVRRGLEGFYRLFVDRYPQVMSGGDFYKLETPARLAPFDPGSSAFLGRVAKLRAQFLECMDDDFNTGGAVGALYELLTALNRFCDAERLEYPNPKSESVVDFQRGLVVLKELGAILGLFQSLQPRVQERHYQEVIGVGDTLAIRLTQLLTELGTASHDQAVDGMIQRLIALRAEARKAKNFALADQIRKRLGELGVTLEDRPGGTGWRVG
jgi:cysteinyl-tRNA synthetase